MDERDSEIAEAAAQTASAAVEGLSNVLIAVINGLIEKGVVSTDNIRDMLEATAKRAEGEFEGDPRRRRMWRRPPQSSARYARSCFQMECPLDIQS